MLHRCCQKSCVSSFWGIAAVVAASAVATIWVDGKLRHRRKPLPSLAHKDIHSVYAATPAAMAETLASSGKVLVKYVGRHDNSPPDVLATRAHRLFKSVIESEPRKDAVLNTAPAPTFVAHPGFKHPGSAYVSVYGRQPKTNVTTSVYKSTSLGRHVPIAPHTEFHFSVWQPRRIAFYAGKMTTPNTTLFPQKPRHETTLIDMVAAATFLRTRHPATWRVLRDAHIVSTASFSSWDAVLDAWDMESVEDVLDKADQVGIAVRETGGRIEMEVTTPVVKLVGGEEALSLNTDLLGNLYYRELMLHSDKHGLAERAWACMHHWCSLRLAANRRVVTSKLVTRNRQPLPASGFDAIWKALSQRVAVQWDKGDLLIVDNERYAHAKPPAVAGGDRELMVMYSDWCPV